MSDLDGSYWTERPKRAPASDSAFRTAVSETILSSQASSAMAKALVLVRDQKYSQRKACAATGVKIASVNRALKAQAVNRPVQKRGRRTRLTADQEDLLLVRVEQDALKNNCLRTHALLSEANKLLEDETTPSLDPLRTDRSSNDKGSDVIRLVPPRSVDALRAEVQLPTLEPFFELLKNSFAEHQFQPSMVANLDETFFQVHKDKSKVLIPSRLRHGFAIDNDASFHLTIVATIFADCSALPPTLIFPLKELPAELISETQFLDSFTFSGQEAGWITREIFADVAQKVLVPEFTRRRRALGPGFEDAWGLLLLDGHSSREDPAALELLRDARIVVITFPSHSSHLLQPLDLWVFLAFKDGTPRQPCSFLKQTTYCST